MTAQQVRRTWAKTAIKTTALAVFRHAPQPQVALLVLVVLLPGASPGARLLTPSRSQGLASHGVQALQRVGPKLLRTPLLHKRTWDLWHPLLGFLLALSSPTMKSIGFEESPLDPVHTREPCTAEAARLDRLPCTAVKQNIALVEGHQVVSVLDRHARHL